MAIGQLFFSIQEKKEKATKRTLHKSLKLRFFSKIEIANCGSGSNIGFHPPPDIPETWNKGDTVMDLFPVQIVGDASPKKSNVTVPWWEGEKGLGL